MSRNDPIREPTLRPATDADSSFVYEVTKAALGEYAAVLFGWDEDEQRAIHERRFRPARSRIIVVEGEDAGVVTVDEEEGRLRLQQLFLLPVAQGRGIGASVLAQVLDEAAGSGRGVVLRVLRSNPRARAFYERHGLAVVTETQTHWYLETPGD